MTSNMLICLRTPSLCTVVGTDATELNTVDNGVPVQSRKLLRSESTRAHSHTIHTTCPSFYNKHDISILSPRFQLRGELEARTLATNLSAETIRTKK